MSKRTEVITFRTDTETKDKIMQLAEEKEWSVAQVVEKICKEYFKERREQNDHI